MEKVVKYTEHWKGGEGVGRAPCSSADVTAPGQPSCHSSQVAQLTLVEVTILFWLLDTGTVSGPIFKWHSHFSHLSSSWESRKASGLCTWFLSLAKFTDPRLPFGSFAESHFPDVS